MSSANGIINFLRFLDKIRDEYEKRRNKSSGGIDFNDTCTPWLNAPTVYMWSLLPAAVFTLAMIATVPRQTNVKQAWWTHFKLPIPMNILEKRSHHVSYSLAFGSAASVILQIFQNLDNILPVSPDSFPFWALVPMKLIACTIYGLAYYPIFVCITYRKIINFVLGSIYLVALIATNLYISAQCTNNLSVSSKLIVAVSVIPTITCQISLLVIFVLNIVRLIRSSTKWYRDVDEDRYDTYCFDYVRNIFQLTKTFEEVNMDSTVNGSSSQLANETTFLLVKKKVEAKVGELKNQIHAQRKVAFVFPPRLVCTVVASFLLVYLLFFVWITQITALLNLFSGIFFDMLPEIYKNNTRSTYDVAQNLFVIHDENNEEIASFDPMYAIYVILYTLTNIVIITLVISFLVAIAQLIFLCLNFRTNLLALYRGDFTWLRPIKYCCSSTDMLEGCFKYAGYQLGYLAWGFILHSVLLGLVLIMLTFGLIIPVVYGFGHFWWTFVQNYFLTFLFAFFIYYSQKILARYVFLVSPSKNLYITNRNLFFCFTFIFFFYNVFLGFVSCLLRILKSALYGIIIIGRLDWSILPRLFEKSDSGYNSYLGFLWIENAHNNPILRCFINQLREAILIKKNNVEMTQSDAAVYQRLVDSYEVDDNWQSVQNENLKRKLSQNKWHLCYTLLRNPHLKKFRKNRQTNLWFNTKIRTHAIDCYNTQNINL